MVKIIYSIWLEDCWITYNSILNNSGYGVHINGGSHYYIHHNNFLGNNPQGSCQAQGEGIGTFWYDPFSAFGNYWSDWVGEGIYTTDNQENYSDLFPSSSIIAPYSGTIVLPWTNTSPSSYGIFFVLLYLLITPTINRIRKREK